MTGALPLWRDVSDGDLAGAAADGDRGAFAEMYDRYADRLYDFCVGMIGDRDAAADCVQDTFCAAATDLGTLRDTDKLRPWLYSIARHHAMRRLRHRYREEVSDAVPDMESREASPETVAGHSELARLVADAAGGLSDRDRELLDLTYRHGLEGPELAEVLGVTLTNANTMVFRLRQTVERSLGALLVARGTRAGVHTCPELVALLKNWDGHFTVLMRKRISRHIDSCHVCEQEQRRRVNPVALLGGAPVFIPAPAWLRGQTLDRVQLTSSGSGIAEAGGHPGGPRKVGKHVAAVVGVPLVCLGAAIAWISRPEPVVAPAVEVGPSSTVSTTPRPTPTGSVQPAPPPPPSVRPTVPPPVRTAAPPTRQPVTTPAATAEPTPDVATTEPTTQPTTEPTTEPRTNVAPPPPPSFFPPLPPQLPPPLPPPAPPNPYPPGPNVTPPGPKVTPPGPKVTPPQPNTDPQLPPLNNPALIPWEPQVPVIPIIPVVP